MHGEWSNFGDCAQTCGLSQQGRVRECLIDYCEPDSLIDVRPCDLTLCGKLTLFDLERIYILVTFTSWTGNWSPCSTTCGTGKRTKYRSCASGACLPEDLQKTERCDIVNCYAPWTEWTSCDSLDCNKTETRRRTRQCLGPPCRWRTEESQSCPPIACSKSSKNKIRIIEILKMSHSRIGLLGVTVM